MQQTTIGSGLVQHVVRSAWAAIFGGGIPGARQHTLTCARLCGVDGVGGVNVLAVKIRYRFALNLRWACGINRANLKSVLLLLLLLLDKENVQKYLQHVCPIRT